SGTLGGARPAAAAVVRRICPCVRRSMTDDPTGRAYISTVVPSPWSNEEGLMVRWFILASVLAVFAPALRADDPLAYERTRDVIYVRKFGTCLTMDVSAPKEKPNGAAVVVVVSGGWFSRHSDIEEGQKAGFGGEFLKRGYTVFAVVHGSQPKFTIPEAIADV